MDVITDVTYLRGVKLGGIDMLTPGNARVTWAQEMGKEVKE